MKNPEAEVLRHGDAAGLAREITMLTWVSAAITGGIVFVLGLIPFIDLPEALRPNQLWVVVASACVVAMVVDVSVGAMVLAPLGHAIPWSNANGRIAISRALAFLLPPAYVALVAAAPIEAIQLLTVGPLIALFVGIAVFFAVLFAWVFVRLWVTRIRKR